MPQAHFESFIRRSLEYKYITAEEHERMLNHVAQRSEDAEREAAIRSLLLALLLPSAPVEIVGLASKPELNGMAGVVLAHPDDGDQRCGKRDRMPVEVHHTDEAGRLTQTGKGISIRMTNLLPRFSQDLSDTMCRSRDAHAARAAAAAATGGSG